MRNQSTNGTFRELASLFFFVSAGAIIGFVYEFGISWYNTWHGIQYPVVFAGEITDWALIGGYWGGFIGLLAGVIVLSLRRLRQRREADAPKKAGSIGEDSEMKQEVWPPPPTKESAWEREETS